VVVDAAAEHSLVLDQEWAGEQNLAARAAPVALTLASACDAGTIILGQHRPDDGTSDLAAQTESASRAPSWSRAAPVDFRTEEGVEGPRLQSRPCLDLEA
jgi:hypothetical protein